MRRLLPTLFCVALLAGCGSRPPAAVAPTPSPQAPAADSLPVAAVDPSLNLESDLRLRLVVVDIMRIGIARSVQQPASGVLRLEAGPGFNSPSLQHHLGRLHSAYWLHDPTRDQPPVIEIYQAGEKLGQYTDKGLALDRQPTVPPAPVAVDRTGEAEPSDVGERHRRGPVYLSVGAGGGAADFLCSECDFEMSTGFSPYGAAGLRVSQNLVLAVEGTGWFKSNAGTKGRIYSVMGTGIGYVTERLPIFISVGIGYVGFHRDTPIGTYRADALGFTTRLGIDVAVGERLAITPYGGLVGSFNRPRFELEGNPSSIEAAIRNLQFGLALTLR